MGIHGVACCKQTKQLKKHDGNLGSHCLQQENKKETRTKAYMSVTQVKGVVGGCNANGTRVLRGCGSGKSPIAGCKSQLWCSVSHKLSMTVATPQDGKGSQEKGRFRV